METKTKANRCDICGRSCRLTARQHECYMKIPERVDPVYHPSFEDPGAQELYFSASAARAEHVRWRLFPEVPEDTYDAPVRKALGREAEAQLFLKYNFARYQLARLQEQQAKKPSVKRAVEMTHWHEQVQHVREELAAANLSLVIAMAKRTRIPNVEFPELISEGNVALLRAIEKFDVSRGFKFSTYACRAILKGFNRMAGKTGRYTSRFGVNFDPELERSDYDLHRDEIERDELVEDVRDVFARNRAALTEIEQTVLRERFGLDGKGEGKTLAEVSRVVGLSNERVRQVQNRAMAKLKNVLGDRYVAA
ncbi:MAG: sigma-70 family RNA polymerase sigma factor [Planctomycetota bacterium]|nr:sigma-70 family RNA polymerase sigma factor [Planctomycetota bacterium]